MERQKQSSRKRRLLEWPPEAYEIAERRDCDAKTKCKELAAASKNDEQACWRFLKGFGVERPPELKRHTYQWPLAQAKVVARSRDSFNSKCKQLQRLTGNPRRACRAFLKRLGVRPPANIFCEENVFPLLDYVVKQGYKKAAEHFKVDRKTLYDGLYRRQLTLKAKDGYTLRDLHIFLCVRSTMILRWVDLGLLKAKVAERSDEKHFHRFDGPEVLRFCRENMPILLPRRWPLKRLEFVALLLLEEVKHADEMDTREAKKEQEEYEKQMEAEAVAKLAAASTSPQPNCLCHSDSASL